MTEMGNSQEMSIFSKEYNLGRERKREPRFYLVQHEVATHGSNGKPKSIDTYKMRLMCEPVDQSTGNAAYKYTCTSFIVKRKNSPEVTIPSMEGWSYEFNKQLLSREGLDSHGQMMGIPHAKFENLTDSNGAKLPIELPYQIYSAFTYFHTCCNMVVEPDQFDRYIGDLKRIGDKNESEISSTEVPINLGSVILDGSKYKTGITVLEFKGLSNVDDKPCAIIGYEEIGGTWVTFIQAMPLMKVKTVGGTQIRSDIYVDLASLWVQKATYIVTDITKTTLFGIPVDISIPVTTHIINAVPEAKF